MGLLDFFMGNEAAGSAAAPVPTAPDDGRSLLQRYLLPDDMNRGTSDRINSVVGAIGAGMLAGNRYQWVNPTAFAASLEASGKDADRAQQRAALKLILKQSNPGLSDAQLEVMANDPATAKLAMAAGEAQAGAKAGQQANGILGGIFGGGGVPAISAAAPPGPAAGASMNGGAGAPPLSGDGAEVQTKFVDSLKAGGLTNPFGLAAVAAYGQHESGYSPGNVNRTWSDPSESGQPGTSGGLLSWRGDRLANMQAATKGAEDPVAAQAQFTLKENPALTEALQRARSPEEANALMAKAWGFAGYDRPGGGEYAARLATTQSYANRFLGADGQRPTQVADASGAMPQPPGMPVVDSRQPGFNPNGGPDPLAGFVSSTGQTNAPSVGMPDLRGVPPVGTNTSSPPPPAPRPRPGMRGPVQVAETENDTQAMEGRMGMYPPSVYGITAEAQGRGSPNADMPAPGAQNAEFFIPPGGGTSNGRTFGPETTTGRVLAARAARSQEPQAAAPAPDFPLNDPKQAAAALPQLFKVLSLPNLPDAQRRQAESMRDYALGIVKPTDRTRQLMEAGYAPGTPEYRTAYKTLVNSDRTPSGYRFTGDGQQLEAIPGGPSDPANKASKAPPTGYRIAEDGQRFEAVPGGPADPATLTAQAQAKAAGKPSGPPKPLPHNAVKDLSAAGESYGDFNRLVGGFRPDYAGWKINAVGDAANQIARTTGIGNTAAADWWADYSAKRNVVRNKLFGAALTAQEKSEFEKADITPAMTPEAIGKNLARQQEAATKAARKMGGYYVQTGRDPGEIEAAMGVGLDELGITPRGEGQPARSPDRANSARPASSAPAPAGVPPAAVNMLRQNPALKAQFDAKYGAGASDSILGGR